MDLLYTGPLFAFFWHVMVCGGYLGFLGGVCNLAGCRQDDILVFFQDHGKGGLSLRGVAVTTETAMTAETAKTVKTATVASLCCIL